MLNIKQTNSNPLFIYPGKVNKKYKSKYIKLNIIPY